MDRFPETLLHIRLIEKKYLLSRAHILEKYGTLDIDPHPSQKVRIHTKRIVDIAIAKDWDSRCEEEEVRHIES